MVVFTYWCIDKVVIKCRQSVMCVKKIVLVKDALKIIRANMYLMTSVRL